MMKMTQCWITTLVTLVSFSIDANAATVFNCTFTKYFGAIAIPDGNMCGLSQYFLDDFNWMTAGADTTTADTGPSSGNGGSGHYAYIDSSNEDAGSYGRLTSRTFTKPASDSGGCVQFYYHMYGADIGTLNVSVYDNTQSGLVANWQKTGNQGDQWLRADMNLNLPAGQAISLQVTFDAYTAGERKSDNKGDIAIDDVMVMTDGQCPQSSETPAPTQSTTSTLATSPSAKWTCDFEDILNNNCGMQLNRFRKAIASLRPSTGPKGGYNSSHFIYMQGLGMLENQTGTAETPHFNKDYNCLSFYYHMYGQGMGSLLVSADVNGLWQPLWSQSGDQGNQWKADKVALPRNAVKIQFKATRGSTADSDIALDNLELSTIDCFGMTVPTFTTSTTTPRPTTRPQPSLQLACNFDSYSGDFCNFYQDDTDSFDWSRNAGGTFTPGTGPDSDHTTGLLQGHYLVAYSSYKRAADTARIISGLIDVGVAQPACLRFSYNMNGDQMGTLNVYIKNSDGTELNKFTETGNQGQTWKTTSVNLLYNKPQIYLVFESIIAYGSNLQSVRGDIAIDDIILTRYSTCQDLDMERVQSPVTVATTTMMTTTGSTSQTPASTSTTTTPTPPTTTTQSTTPTTPSPVQICNFDQSAICGYEQDKGDKFDWSRLNTRTWSGNTGPEFDHTTGNGDGYFMYIESSFKIHDDRARLLSPNYSPLSTQGCLTFSYHMWGKDMGSLNVSIIKDGQTVVQIWSIAGDQGNQWNMVQVGLDYSAVSTSFRIVFDGYIAHQLPPYSEVLGDIAIDDVSVDRQTPCSSSPPSSSTLPASGNTKQQSTSSVTTSPLSSSTKESKTSSLSSKVTKPFSSTSSGLGKKSGQSSTKSEGSSSGGMVAGIVIGILVALLGTAVVGLIFMRRRQLWLFAPGSRLSVAFNRKHYSDTAGLYDTEDNKDEYTTAPHLTINGFNGNDADA